MFNAESPFFPPKTLLEKKMNILWQIASQIYDVDDDTSGEFSRSVTLLYKVINRMVGQLKSLQQHKFNDDELKQLENELKVYGIENMGKAEKQTMINNNNKLVMNMLLTKTNKDANK